LFVACFRHKEIENGECGKRDRSQEKKAGVETKVMQDGTEREMEPPRAARKV
jgi:hypothetical protein